MVRKGSIRSNSRAVVVYNIITGERREFNSITAAAVYTDASVTTVSLKLDKVPFNEWLYISMDKEREKANLIRFYTNKGGEIKPRSPRSNLVALRIDSKTVIMVTPDKANEKYAAEWRERHENDSRR